MHVLHLICLVLGSPIPGVDPPAASKVPEALKPIAAELYDVYGVRSCGSALNENAVWLFPPAVVDLQAEDAMSGSDLLCATWANILRSLEPTSNHECAGAAAESVSPHRDIAGCAYQRINQLRAAIARGEVTELTEHGEGGSALNVQQAGQELLDSMDSELTLVQTRTDYTGDDDRGAMTTVEDFMAKYQAVTSRMLAAAMARCMDKGGVDSEGILLETYNSLIGFAEGAARRLDTLVDVLGRRHVLTLTGKKNMLKLGPEHNGQHAASLCRQPLYCSSVLSRAHLENAEVRDQNGAVHDNALEPMVVYRAQINNADFLEASVSLTRRSVCGNYDQGVTVEKSDPALSMTVYYHYWDALVDRDDPVLFPSCIASADNLAHLFADESQFQRFFSLAPWDEQYLTHVERTLAAQCLHGKRFDYFQNKFDAATAHQVVVSMQRLYQSMITRALERFDLVKLVSWEQRGKQCGNPLEQVWYGQTRSIYPQYVNATCDSTEPIAHHAIHSQLQVLAASNKYAPLQESWWFAAKPISEGVAVRFHFGNAMAQALRDRGVM